MVPTPLGCERAASPAPPLPWGGGAEPEFPGGLPQQLSEVSTCGTVSSCVLLPQPRNREENLVPGSRTLCQGSGAFSPTLRARTEAGVEPTVTLQFRIWCHQPFGSLLLLKLKSCSPAPPLQGPVACHRVPALGGSRHCHSAPVSAPAPLFPGTRPAGDDRRGGRCHPALVRGCEQTRGSSHLGPEELLQAKRSREILFSASLDTQNLPLLCELSRMLPSLAPSAPLPAVGARRVLPSH